MRNQFYEKGIPLLMVPGIFFTDFFVKRYIEQYGEDVKGKKIWKGKIKLTKHHNSGLAMDILEHKTEWVLAASSVMVAILCIMMALVMPKKGKRLLKYGFAFLIGGAAGNLYDRAVRRYVVDYFSFQTGIAWIDRIIFNLSDLCILVGIVLVAVGDAVRKV
jgi:signal peptidase II